MTRKIKTFIFVAILTLALPVISHAQAKKPTLIVVPGKTWCVSNGYVVESSHQGRIITNPDYERALGEDFDLVNVITKINELMAERGFPMKDLSASIGDLNQMEMEDEMTVSTTSGAELAETPLERLQRRAKADIIVEVAWKINSTGPKKSITYNLRGLDAYTSKQIAAAQGTGNPSFSAEVPILLEEAVIEKMNQFQSQLQAYFDDMVENGREVNLRLQVFNNGSGLSFEKEYGDGELSEIIDQWMDDNTVKHRYSLSDASENVMNFEQVRIPLYNERGRAMDTRMFARKLQKFLQAQPYNITSKIKAGGGLGRVTLVLGEK